MPPHPCTNPLFINSQRFKKMLVWDTFGYLTSQNHVETKQSSANLFTLTTASTYHPPQLVPTDLKRAQTGHHCHDQLLLYYHTALGNLNTLQISQTYANIESLMVHCYRENGTSFYKTMATRIIFIFPFLN